MKQINPGVSNGLKPGPKVVAWLKFLPVMAGMIALLHSLADGFAWQGPVWTLFAHDLMNLPNAFMAVLACLLLAQRFETEDRSSWRWFAAGFAWILTGMLIGHLNEHTSIQIPEVFQDAAKALFPLSFFIGLMRLSASRISKLEHAKLGLDVAVIITACLVVLWNAFLGRLLLGAANEPLTFVIHVCIPTFELTVVALLLLPGFGRRVHNKGPHFGLLCLGMLMVFLADSFIAFRELAKIPTPEHPIDLLYAWSFVMFALAAWLRLSFKLPETRAFRLPQFLQFEWLIFLPYVGALVAMGVMGQQFGRTDGVALGIFAGNGLIGMMVMARQAIALSENSKLNRELLAVNASLETRVRDRENALEQSKERLIAADRLASLGQLTGGIAHEVNTPLAAAMNFLHQANALSEEYKNSIDTPTVTKADHLEIANELKGNISSAQTTLERLGEFVRSIRNQGRSLGAGATNYNLVAVVRDTVGMLEFEARRVDVKIRFESASDNITIYGEPGRIAQIVQNLVGNAIHACESRRIAEGSEVTVRLSRGLGGYNQGRTPVFSENVLLSVEDNGSGIPPEVLPRIFEPLYSTKEIGRGTGLGLSIIKDIITGHLGGEITLETRVGLGTTFKVSFPVAHAPQVELPGVRNFEPSRNTVIVGDD